jgi:hypothetical protein
MVYQTIYLHYQQTRNPLELRLRPIKQLKKGHILAQSKRTNLSIVVREKI